MSAKKSEAMAEKENYKSLIQGEWSKQSTDFFCLSQVCYHHGISLQDLATWSHQDAHLKTKVLFFITILEAGLNEICRNNINSNLSSVSMELKKEYIRRIEEENHSFLYLMKTLEGS